MQKHLTLITAAVLSCGLFSNQLLAEESTMNLSNKDKAVALLNSIESGDQNAATYVNPNQYIQHNLAVADGLAGFGAVLQALPKDSAKVNVVRSFTDGDFVFTQTDYNFFGPKVGFDVFRFENGLIVEHWDNLVEKANKPNPSGRTQLDGTTAVTALDKTAENKALIAQFIDNVLVNGAFDQLPTFINATQYHQHNTDIADGLDGLGAAIAALEKQGIKMIYHKNHAVLGEGNFVLAISEGTFGDKPVSYYDLFRVEAGKIVEHWDVIEPILAEAERKNQNGKFGGL